MNGLRPIDADDLQHERSQRQAERHHAWNRAAMTRPRRFSSTTTFIQISLTTQGTPPMTPCSRVRMNHATTLSVRV